MNNRKSNQSTEVNIKKVILVCLSAFIFLTVSFYYLAGDQLKYRESRGNLSLPISDSITAELSNGVVVEQHFSVKIQRLSSVSVQMETFYRDNSGLVTVSLLREDNGELLMSKSVDAADISEGEQLTIAVENPIETVCDVPLILRITGDSEPSHAVAPLMTKESDQDGFELYIGDELVSGRLCFSAKGTDHIWTGIHYWTFVACFGAVLMALSAVVLLRWKRGKRSYIINALAAMKKYSFLIRQLVGRDFKTKYKRSVLGMFWSFLNPLLMMLVQYFVFSTIFKSDIPYFAAYLIIGTVLFNFFSESCGMTLTSILGNAGLISKVYMPKYIYPLTRTLSSVINLAISLIPMLAVCIITGVHLKRAAVLSVFFFVCLIIFCLGFGMILATSMVFFRDTQFLWNVLNIMWMYATPIFYPETIIPEYMRMILLINPLYYLLKAVRMCILDGVSPEPRVYLQCLLIALGMLGVGATVFYKNQDKFVLYL